MTDYRKYRKYKHKYARLKFENVLDGMILFLLHFTTIDSLKGILKDKKFIPNGGKFYTSIIVDETDLEEAMGSEYLWGDLMLGEKFQTNYFNVIIDKKCLWEKEYYHISYWDSLGVIDEVTYFSDGIYRIIKKAGMDRDKYIEYIQNASDIDDSTKNRLKDDVDEYLEYYPNQNRNIEEVICRNRTIHSPQVATAEFLEPVEIKYIIGLYFPHKDVYLKNKTFFDGIGLKLFFDKIEGFTKNPVDHCAKYQYKKYPSD